jgi:hypothetical protein
MKRLLSLFLMIVTAVAMAAPALAQTTTSPSGGLGPPGGPFPSKINPQYPRDNVKGGAVGSRTPGAWTAAGVARTTARQAVMLKDFGGVTLPAASTTPGLRNQLIVAALDQFFKTLNQLVQDALPGIIAGIGGGGTTTQPSTPVQ